MEFWVEQCGHVRFSLVYEIEVAEELDVIGLEGLFHSHSVGKAILDVFIEDFLDSFWWECFWVILDTDHFREPIWVVVVGLVHSVQAIVIIDACGTKEGSPTVSIGETILQNIGVDFWWDGREFVDDESIEVTSAEFFCGSGTPEGDGSVICKGDDPFGFGIIANIPFAIIKGLEYAEDVSDGLFSEGRAPEVLSVMWSIIGTFKGFGGGGVGFSAASMANHNGSMPRC